MEGIGIDNICAWLWSLDLDGDAALRDSKQVFDLDEGRSSHRHIFFLKLPELLQKPLGPLSRRRGSHYDEA